MDQRNIKNVEIDPHSSEDAILLRYDAEELNGKFVKKSKIIQLKNFSDQLNPSTLAKSIIDQCSLIGQERISDVEQVIFYLQKRASNKHEIFKANGNTDPSNGATAHIEHLENYIEMLYEEGEKLKASSLILSLCLKAANLKAISENGVLVGALTRVFREDSRKNFELGTNLASIFFQLSLFTKFHQVLSHHKIGALSLQLLENELKRFDLWQDQYQHAPMDQKRKWELAMKKQEIFMVECLKILANLAVETKTEVKMVKRGLLNTLSQCLDRTKFTLLLKTTILFLWKLSVYTKNKDAMEKLKVVERVIDLLGAPSSDQELSNIIFGLLFNLSFDPSIRSQMVALGLINHVAANISNNEVALGLLYQLSIVDDAKAMFTFTDSIQGLMQLLRSSPTNSPSSLSIKGTLMNLAVEKRNAQLICGADGSGLKTILELSFKQSDAMLMKLARNLASHEGSIQQHFVPYLPQFIQTLQNSSKQIPMPTFAIESLAVVASLGSLTWSEMNNEVEALSQYAAKILRDQHASKMSHFSDELLIQIVALCGMFAAQATSVASKVLEWSDDLIKLLNQKQEDDEFVLQIAFCFARLIANPDLIRQICTEKEPILEYLINMTHDKNQELCKLCDQALQLVSEIDKQWFKRIAQERFCFHNAQWLDIVEGQGSRENALILSEDEEFVDDESFLSEQFRNAVFGADEILGSGDLSE